MHALVAGLFLVSAVGTAAELYLLGHYESAWQCAPLAAIGLGVVTGLQMLIRPTPGLIRVHRLVMAILTITGLIGFYRHMSANLEWEQELHSSIKGLPMVWNAMKGAIPALVPFALAQLGALGFLSTYRHPRLPGSPARRAVNTKED
jgi:hypothetical protein